MAPTARASGEVVCLVNSPNQVAAFCMGSVSWLAHINESLFAQAPVRRQVIPRSKAAKSSFTARRGDHEYSLRSDESARAKASFE